MSAADPQTGLSLTERAKDILFPSGAFSGPDEEENARNTSKARCIMFFFYLAFMGFFAYQVCVFFFLGRVEVASSTYKMNSVEAPSVVVCPFWPKSEILLPEGEPLEEILHVTKYGVSGPERLRVVPHTCRFDRVCICGDFWDLGPDGGPVIFRDHRISETENIGATGEESESEVRFRERIEVKTNATDGSGNNTLKVGFYDSVDEAPQWFYMHQGAYMLGNLELSTWSVQRITFASVFKALQGDTGAMVKERHIFRYTSQEVAHDIHDLAHPDHEETKPEETIFSYRMKNFFVDHKVAAETSFSIYAAFSLLIVVAVRGTAVSAFISIMFPEYDAHKGETKRREMSNHADFLAQYLCCFCCFRRRSPQETTRLLP
jgi:hypothetical protein